MSHEFGENDTGLKHLTEAARYRVRMQVSDKSEDDDVEDADGGCDIWSSVSGGTSVGAADRGDIFWQTFVPNTTHLRESYAESDERMHGKDPLAREKEEHSRRLKEAPYMSHRDAVDAGESEDETFWFNIVLDSHKALYRFLRIVASGITPVSIEDIVDWDLWIKCARDGRMSDHNFENSIHHFVNIVNFCIVRILGLLRSYALLKQLTLLDLIFNEQACNHFAALVCDLWKDSKIDRGVVYMNAYAMLVADQCNNDDHLQYFAKLSGIPAKDLEFKGPRLAVHEFIPGGRESSDRDRSRYSDLYVTPETPLLFFIRMTLQAMHAHDSVNFSRALKNLQMDRLDVISLKDATPEQLRDIVFDEIAALGYADALGALHTKGSCIGHEVTSIRIFEWVKNGLPYSAAFLAHLVATYTNLQYVSKNKTDSREKLLDRLSTTKNRLVDWVLYFYKNPSL